jgi:hypothetical protein
VDKLINILIFNGLRLCPTLKPALACPLQHLWAHG